MGMPYLTEGEKADIDLIFSTALHTHDRFESFHIGYEKSLVRKRLLKEVGVSCYDGKHLCRMYRLTEKCKQLARSRGWIGS